MRAARVIGYIFSSICLAFGLLATIASSSENNSNPKSDLTVGLILLALGLGVLILLLKFRPTMKLEQTIVQKVDLSGATSLNNIKCKSCGAQLAAESVKVAADGAVVVSCPYCNSAYQITEAPKW